MPVAAAVDGGCAAAAVEVVLAGVDVAEVDEENLDFVSGAAAAAVAEFDATEWCPLPRQQ